MDPVLTIIAVIAGAFLGVVAERLGKRYLPQPLSRRRRTRLLIGFILIAILAALPSLNNYIQTKEKDKQQATSQMLLNGLVTDQAAFFRDLTANPSAQDNFAQATGTALDQEIATLKSELTVNETFYLGGGHSPPDAQGNSVPIFPPVTPENDNQAIRIQIPTLNIDAPIVQGDLPGDLKKGVGQKIGTANPGEKGVMILTAYNDINGELFRYIDTLMPGDEIKIITTTSSFIYNVIETRVLENNQFDFSRLHYVKMVAIISTYPYLVDNKYFVVIGELRE